MNLKRRAAVNRRTHRAGVVAGELAEAAVTGALTLAPAGKAQQTLAEDYRHMVEDSLRLDDAEPFDVLLQRCRALALRVNPAVLRAAWRSALASKSACRGPLVG